MSSAVISLIGILIGLAMLIFLAYRGYSILFISPIAAVVVILFSGVGIIETLTGPYMGSYANFATKNYLLFFTSALFGKAMGDCGAAKVIAYKIAGAVRKYPGKQKFLAVMSIVIVNSVLTLGGISAFVVVFTLVTIAKNVFEELNVPWRLYTCASLGQSVYTLTMIPGSPSVQNLIPCEYLGTTPTAAPVLGIVCAVIAFLIGSLYISYQVKIVEKNDEGFMPSGSVIKTLVTTIEEVPNLSLLKCLVPSIILFIVLNGFKQSPITSLTVAILITCILFRKQFVNIKKTIADGGTNALMSIGNVCAVVGFGGVVASVPGYDLVLGALDKIPGPPIVQLIVAVNVAAGITGSASGGLGIALGSLSERFLNMGLSADVIHRVACMSSGGLDSLPHNGSIINTLTVSGLGHKAGYGHIFVLTVLVPIVVTIIAGVLVQLGLVF